MAGGLFAGLLAQILDEPGKLVVVELAGELDDALHRRAVLAPGVEGGDEGGIVGDQPGMNVCLITEFLSQNGEVFAGWFAIALKIAEHGRLLDTHLAGEFRDRIGAPGLAFPFPVLLQNPSI